MTQNTSQKPARSEAYFLKLSLRKYRKRIRKLLGIIEKFAEPHFKGMSVYDSTDDALSSIPHISTYRYARLRGIDPGELISLLEDCNVIRRIFNTTYIVSPLAHRHLCFYKRIEALRGNVRHCLYWNADGVRFLNDFVNEHGISVKREFTF